MMSARQALRSPKIRLRTDAETGAYCRRRRQRRTVLPCWYALMADRSLLCADCFGCCFRGSAGRAPPSLHVGCFVGGGTLVWQPSCPLLLLLQLPCWQATCRPACCFWGCFGCYRMDRARSCLSDTRKQGIPLRFPEPFQVGPGLHTTAAAVLVCGRAEGREVISVHTNP